MSKAHRKHIHRDVVLSSILTFILLLLLKLIFVNAHYLDPIYQALSDFQFTDLYYSQYQKRHISIDTNIVIVNIANNGREGILRELETIKSYHPKTFGLDVTFSERKDIEIDSLLKISLHGNVPVVLTKNLIYPEGEEGGSDESGAFKVEGNNPFFEKQQDEGFGNFLAEEGQSVRYFTPFIKHDETKLPSFDVKIIEAFDSIAYKRLLERGHSTEIINYLTTRIPKIDAKQLTKPGTDLHFLKNKIVLMGYMGPNLEEKVFEDNHVTPLNKSYGGRSLPDMYGVEIHANIISMALRNDYIAEVPSWLTFVIAFLVCGLHMYVFIHLYVEHHKWFHLGAKIFQLVSFAFFVFLSIGMFHWLRLKLEPTYILAGVLLSCDALYFYEGLMEFMQDRFDFQTYFKKDHH